MSPRIVNLANFPQFTAVNISEDPGAIGGPVIVPQCAQIALQWNLDNGKHGTNVLYGRYAGGFAGTVAQANSILTALNTGPQWTALAAFLSTTTLLGPVTLRDVNTANQPIITSTAAGALGTSASPGMPNEIALVGTTRTAFAGRSFRGRIYIPGWATNALAAGNVASAPAVTALQNWLNTIAAALSAQGYTWVIGQKKRAAYTGSTGTAHPARDATSTQISAVIVRDNHWDSQRRRGLK